jgi:hypothetical protein
MIQLHAAHPQAAKLWFSRRTRLLDIYRPRSTIVILSVTLSCRTIPRFVIGYALYGLLRNRCRNRREEKRAVMAAHARMTSHNLEEEEATQFIPPSLWSGRIYLIFAAIRAALQSNPTHNEHPSSAGHFTPHRGVASVQDCTPLPPRKRAVGNESRGLGRAPGCPADWRLEVRNLEGQITIKDRPPL